MIGIFQITHYTYDREAETDRDSKVSYFNKLKKQYRIRCYLNMYIAYLNNIGIH